MNLIIRTAALIFLLYVTTTNVLADDQKAVLVTGASSGIGLKITEFLSAKGYYVYAGARKEKDLKRLNDMDNVSSVKLDVTVDAEIMAAAEYVKAQGRGLFGVINNAGVGVFSPMSTMPVKDVAWIHDVNVLGPHRINQAFLPLLKESKGRTAVIGSISGYLTSASGGGYSMSKFAVEAYTESLADALKKDGIAVAVIEPGGYRSKIREKVAMHLVTGNYKLGQKLTKEQEAQVEDMRKRNAALKEPDEVAEAALKFLTAESPQLRYMVAPNKEEAELTVKAALSRVVQLNQNQPYAMTREALIKQLDEYLAKPEKK